MAEMVGKPSVIKLLNKDIIEGIIRAEGPITKPDIAKKTQLSVVTVNKIVESLVSEAKVKISGVNESTGGRRAQAFEINYESNYYIGLYYYKNNYIGAVANSVGELIFEESFAVRTEHYDEVMEDTCKAIDQLIAVAHGNSVKAIGIGVPGVVKNGVVTDIPHIPSWEGKNLSDMLQEKYEIPVYLENDINLTTLGLYLTRYQQKKVTNMALVYLDQGIGSGFIINHALFKGSSNFAGEVSYLPVRRYLPEECQQSKYKGSFEAQISLIREALSKADSQTAPKYKEMLVKTIADGLLGVICILNPEIVVIKCSSLNQWDMDDLVNLLETSVESHNVPFLVRAGDLTKSSIQGVIRMCIRESTSSYSLSNKKRG